MSASGDQDAPAGASTEGHLETEVSPEFLQQLNDALQVLNPTPLPQDTIADSQNDLHNQGPAQALRQDTASSNFAASSASNMSIGQESIDASQQPHSAAASANSGNTLASLGLGVDDQLLVDSLRSIIASESEAGGAATHAVHESSMRGGQDAHDLSLSLGSIYDDSTTDAATLHAVQSVLQGLGSGWNETATRQGSRPRRTRNLVRTEEERLRLREEARDRKRKWRDLHAVRNKDNDLRARLLRRAQMIFGARDSPEKTLWIEEEFLKRREKRMLREISDRSRDNDLDARARARSLIGDHLSELFKESNAYFEQPKKVFTAGLIPEHLVRMPLIPAPDRPRYRYEAGACKDSSAKHTFYPSTDPLHLGFPPNISLVLQDTVKVEETSG